MFYAIDKSTKQKVNSLTIEEDPSYNFLKEEGFYADPDEIESFPKEIDINKINVNFRSGSSAISIKGKKYLISPHFYIPNKTKLGINTIPESKEHKLAKNWIYNKLKEKKLILNYSQITKPYKYKNKINLFDLPIDITKLGIEVTSSKIGNLTSRRADIICPFLKKHDILGNGIVVEIQFSKQKTNARLSREYDWSIRGYSLGWLHINDFEEISDNFIQLKEDSINISSFASLIKQNKKDFIKQLKFVVMEESKKIDNKLLEHSFAVGDLIDLLTKKEEEILENINKKKVEKVEINKEEIERFLENKFNKLKNTLQPLCPQCQIPMLLKSNKSQTSKFWGCSNFPGCRHTSNYIN